MFMEGEKRREKKGDRHVFRLAGNSSKRKRGQACF
jgi:hypothetical protein